MLSTLCRYSGLICILLLFGEVPVHAGNPKATAMQHFFVIKQIFPKVERVGILLSKREKGKEKLLKTINRAAAATGHKAIVAEVTSLSDIAAEFQTLVKEYRIQAIWIPDDQEELTNPIARDYLIQKSVLYGIPLVAPKTEWVQRGACFTLTVSPSGVRLFANPKTLQALGTSIPEAYQAKTQFAVN